MLYLFKITIKSINVLVVNFPQQHRPIVQAILEEIFFVIHFVDPPVRQQLHTQNIIDPDGDAEKEVHVWE